MRSKLLPVNVLLGLSLLAGSCADLTPVAPEAPQYIRGPGCTIIYKYQLEPTIAELVVQHFDVCPQILYDSTLAASRSRFSTN